MQGRRKVIRSVAANVCGGAGSSGYKRYRRLSASLLAAKRIVLVYQTDVQTCPSVRRKVPKSVCRCHFSACTAAGLT